MNIIASFQYDRAYFVLYYSTWLKYRSRWRRFAIPFALLFLFVAVALTIIMPNQWMLTVFLIVAALVNFVDTMTYRWRYIRKHLRTMSREKHIQLNFHDDYLAIKSPNSEGTIRYVAFTTVCVTPDGLFLVPESGVSLFVPRTAFHSESEYQMAAQTAHSKHASS